MIRVNDEQYWLYVAVDPVTNRFRHVRLSPTYMIAITKAFIAELSQKHDVDDAVFLVDDARELEPALRRSSFEYRVERHGLRNKTERVFREVERRTSSLSNYYSHTDPATANSWPQAFAVWWKQWLS